MLVIEDVIDARSPAELADRLPAALARHLGWQGAFDPATRTIVPVGPDAQVAARLGIAQDTVEKHLTGALTKADCTTRTQLAVVWRSHHGGRPS